MRIVATSDTHFPFDQTLIPEGDVFIHAGDLMYSGLPDEWPALLESLRVLPHKRKILVPGNHDFHIQNYLGVARAQLRKVGVTLITEERPWVQVEGIGIAGIPFVTGLWGWAFNRMEEQVEEYFEAHPQVYGADILVTHAPPYRILDNIPGTGNVGCLTYNKQFYTKGLEPQHWVCGHIHESYGQMKPAGRTVFHNVAMCNRDYKQVNPAHVFDI